MRSAQYVAQVVDVVGGCRARRWSARSAAALPLTGSWSRTGVELPGRGKLEGEGDEIDRAERVVELPAAAAHSARCKGRYLSDEDREGSTPVIVINQAAAQRYWPGQEAMGQRITINKKERTVVGIVGNIHHLGPEIAPRQEGYIPGVQDRAVRRRCSSSGRRAIRWPCCPPSRRRSGR